MTPKISKPQMNLLKRLYDGNKGNGGGVYFHPDRYHAYSGTTERVSSGDVYALEYAGLIRTTPHCPTSSTRYITPTGRALVEQEAAKEAQP